MAGVERVSVSVAKDLLEKLRERDFSLSEVFRVGAGVCLLGAGVESYMSDTNIVRSTVFFCETLRERLVELERMVEDHVRLLKK